jgi:hypothetical protein
MGIFDEVIKVGKRLFNSEKSDIVDVGFDDVRGNINQESIDWGEKLPDLVIPSVKNLRLCAEKSPIVNGILEDLVIKSISGWVIEGDTQEAIDFIINEDERMDYSTLMHNLVWNNCVEGVDFREIVVDKNEVTLRELAYDGENYRIKELYDDDTGAKIIGYKQIVKVNQNTNKGWFRKKFNELVYNREQVEFDFEPEDLMVASFFRRHDKPRGIVANVLDDAYMHQMLKKMMPQVVFKQANTLFLQIGNKERKEVNISDSEIDDMVTALSDYHNLGVTAFPFGIEPQLIGDTNLPKIQDFLNYLEHCIFVGLFTPEAIYSSSSSNRSTAVVQLDSDKSGRVLVQEYIQEKLSRYMEKLFKLMLEYKGINGKVWINFNPEVNEGTYLEDTDNNLDDDSITNENDNISTSKPTDGMNYQNISNGEGRLAEVSS